MNKPKILHLDYESSPAKGYFFGSKWETTIAKIIEYEQIISVAWGWEGEETNYVKAQCDFKGYRKGKINDYELIKFFSDIISEADYVVAFNGDSFDVRVFNTRLLFHRLPPIPEFKTFDPKKLIKSKFRLPSNSEDELAKFLNIKGKAHHIGIDMWLGCEAGDPKMWKMLKYYNKQDVKVMREEFKIILPYVKLPKYFYEGRKEKSKINILCSNPICLSDNLKLHHKKLIASGGYRQQYQCKDCGRYTTDPKLIKPKKDNNT